MISQLRGTLIEALPTSVILDVNGMAFELGISAQTAASLPAVGTSSFTLFTRLVVREDAMELYGFATREERALFNRLILISGVGPKLTLAILSTFTPAQLATVVASQDQARLATVSGVGKRKASRLLLELEGVFTKDAELRTLVGLTVDMQAAPVPVSGIYDDAVAALLSMGFTSQEAVLALEGYDIAHGSLEDALTYALHRLGGRS